MDAFRDFNRPRRSIIVSSTCGTLSKKKVRPDDQAGRRSFGQGQTQATWEPSRWFYEESSTNPKSNRIAIAYLYSLGGGCKVRMHTIQPALLTTLLGNSNHPASKWNTNFTIYTHHRVVTGRCRSPIVRYIKHNFTFRNIT